MNDFIASPAKSSPLNLFISYSHEDHEHCAELRKHLASLSKYVHTWYDGCIPAGGIWNDEIERNLQESQIVILLVSPDFIASEYCRKEFEEAEKLRERRKTKIIPVIVRDANWQELGINAYEAIPQSPPKHVKPVKKWEDQDEAWTSVTKEINKAILAERRPQPVSDALEVSEEAIEAADQYVPEAKSRLVRRTFASVKEFWTSVRHQGQLQGIDLVTVRGTFSQFAPMMMGPPWAKRAMHRDFRLAVEKHKRLGQAKRATFNACMSVSSGQMVHRQHRPDLGKMYFGLYGSIVRNSIPVFVLRDYFEKELNRLFIEHDCDAFEATVVGRVFQTDNSELRDYIDRHEMTEFIAESVINDLCDYALTLAVDGDGTSISYAGPAAYLDGDIWLALEIDGRERFLTAFLDVADPNDRERELERLLNERANLQGIARLIGHFDERLQSRRYGDHRGEKGPIRESPVRAGLELNR